MALSLHRDCPYIKCPYKESLLYSIALYCYPSAFAKFLQASPQKLQIYPIQQLGAASASTMLQQLQAMQQKQQKRASSHCTDLPYPLERTDLLKPAENKGCNLHGEARQVCLSVCGIGWGQISGLQRRQGAANHPLLRQPRLERRRGKLSAREKHFHRQCAACSTLTELSGAALRDTPFTVSKYTASYRQ